MRSHNGSEASLRLPEEKKRFLDTAWEEFTKIPFTEASINKIVLRARVPRGIFYQHFANKEEPFFCLLGGTKYSLGLVVLHVKSDDFVPQEIYAALTGVNFTSRCCRKAVI